MKDKILSNIENNNRWYILIVCLIGFFTILINVLNDNIQSFDTFIYKI